MKCTVDGSWTLDEQRIAIQCRELSFDHEMVSFIAAEEIALGDSSGNTFPLNIVTFQDSNSPPPDLHIERAASRQQIPSIIANNLTQRRNFICTAEAYVDGAKAFVVCFRES